MKIELRKISDIKPYPQNPRVNDDAVDAVAASIREFGFKQPLVVDTESVIIVDEDSQGRSHSVRGL
jgi:ParB-like chromosome segregation protein Spo0J